MRHYIYLIEVLPIAKERRLWSAKWQVVMHSNTGTETVTGMFARKMFAVASARAIAKRTAKKQGTNLRLELQIKGRDGRIQRKDSYGVDPRATKG